MTLLPCNSHFLPKLGQNTQNNTKLPLNWQIIILILKGINISSQSKLSKCKKRFRTRIKQMMKQQTQFSIRKIRKFTNAGSKLFKWAEMAKCSSKLPLPQVKMQLLLHKNQQTHLFKCMQQKSFLK
ncbi:hypothetical protein FGO68_gene11196 [Halteria grandinella]|uniref:Uncharacterized protein n=1 Tax=Halteria grandinella TaxID=5974 RepID=A0A8J8T8W3_HALGN|nr:hypothetical protein FGO68_gene11196 [Halteria grandinella]